MKSPFLGNVGTAKGYFENMEENVSLIMCLKHINCTKLSQKVVKLTSIASLPGNMDNIEIYFYKK